jgi:CheY-like chemotaxis protein
MEGMDTEVPKILLVEDSDSDALLIERAFRKAGVANGLVRMSNGVAAKDYLQTVASSDVNYDTPLFVLLDLKLPGLSGHELLRWIRSEDALRNLPVVIVTGSERPEEQSAVELAGATAFYRKQLSFDKLVDLIHSTGAYWSLQTPTV